MKKIILIICSVIFMSANVFASQMVVDEAMYFTNEQILTLEEKIKELVDEYDVDLTLLLTDDTKGENLENYAEFHSALDQNRDGVIFAVDIAKREYFTISRGIASTHIMSDQALDKIDSAIIPDLSNDDFYGAFLEYTDEMDKFLKAYESGDAYAGEVSIVFVLISLGIGFFISLVIMLFIVNSLVSKMSTAKMNTHATNYIKVGSFNLNLSRDEFISSHTSKVKVQSSSSGGKGSRSSFKSGGRRGGRF